MHSSSPPLVSLPHFFPRRNVSNSQLRGGQALTLCSAAVLVHHPLFGLPEEPFNAEPELKDLVSSYVTPVEFFYKKNHGPITFVDDLDKYSVSIIGLRGIPIELFMKDIWFVNLVHVTTCNTIWTKTC